MTHVLRAGRGRGVLNKCAIALDDWTLQRAVANVAVWTQTSSLQGTPHCSGTVPYVAMQVAAATAAMVGRHIASRTLEVTS